MDVVQDGHVVREDVPLRNAMNEVLRDAYVEDCQRGVDKWNRAIAARGVRFELRLPSRRVDRGAALVAREPCDAQRDAWLPSEADKAFVASLMAGAVTEPAQMAHWIA